MVRARKVDPKEHLSPEDTDEVLHKRNSRRSTSRTKKIDHAIKGQETTISTTFLSPPNSLNEFLTSPTYKPDIPFPASPIEPEARGRCVLINGVKHSNHEAILRWIEFESKYISLLQQILSPKIISLSRYLGVLGTHTAFLVGLPIIAWCGFVELTVDLACLLASGVYVTGCLKDFMCLPRPFSPPVVRVSSSKSTSLEYGFPSTHTANASSLSFVAAFHLRHVLDKEWYWLLDLICVSYAVIVGISRIITGMHTFFDVISGGITGTILVAVYYDFGLKSYMNSSMNNLDSLPWISILMAWIAISFHPDPLGPCPCFDDSVAFISVITGIWWAVWLNNYYNIVPLAAPSLTSFALRIVIGVFSLLIFRLITKRICYTILPPFLSNLRIPFGRRFFKVVGRDYTAIPSIGSYLPSALHMPFQDSERCNLPRYDVDIVTKFIVYSGIGLMAIHALPLLFTYLQI